MPESRVVTFTTDFGLGDAFAGILHGVVLHVDPDASIVDISHAVASYDVLDGAWTIAQSYRYFPPHTVHVVIVDPGVGSKRRPILAETADYIFVAPDNGVLTLVLMREPKCIVRHITAERHFIQPVSQTFHGRDIFAPVAGWLSKGVAPKEFGPEISDYVRLPLPAVEHIGANALRGMVMKVDKFGNLVTNIAAQDVPALMTGALPRISLLIADLTITRFCHSYAEGSDDEAFAILGSSGYLEIAIRQASAAEKLGAGVGAPVGVVLEA